MNFFTYRTNHNLSNFVFILILQVSVLRGEVVEKNMTRFKRDPTNLLTTAFVIEIAEFLHSSLQDEALR